MVLFEKEKQYCKPGSSDYPFYTSYRLCVAFVSFFVFMNMYAHRMAMSVTIVKMVNHSALHMHHKQETPMQEVLSEDGGAFLYFLLKNESQISHLENEEIERNISTNESLENKDIVHSCLGGLSPSSAISEDGMFEWDKVMQSHIIGAFYYGYMVSQVLGGFLSQRYSAKLVVTVCLTFAALSSILTPVAAVSLGAISLVVLRIFVGIASGATYPALLYVMSQWAPPNDRTKMIGIMFAGGGLGLIITNPLSAFLCETSSAGWKLVFYVFGVNSLLILPIWVTLISDSPHQQKYCISEEEKDYITFQLRGQAPASVKHGHSTPWLRMLTSGPVWAIVLAMCATDWGYTMYLSYIPTYMYEVLRFDLKSNGLLSSLPFVGHWILLILCPMVTDAILSSKLLTVSTTRKLVHIIGCGGAAIFLICLSFIDCSRAMLGVAMLTGGVTISACVYSGFPVNIVDLSPAHSGTILGLSNTLSSVMGFMSAYVISALTMHQTQEEWQRVFFISAAIYVIGMLLYCILGRCELQPWAIVGLQSNVTAVNLSASGLSSSGIVVTSVTGKDLQRENSQSSTSPMLNDSLEVSIDSNESQNNSTNDNHDVDCEEDETNEVLLIRSSSSIFEPA